MRSCEIETATVHNQTPASQSVGRDCRSENLQLIEVMEISTHATIGIRFDHTAWVEGREAARSLVLEMNSPYGL